jgi:hypothetical protein
MFHYFQFVLQIEIEKKLYKLFLNIFHKIVFFKKTQTLKNYYIDILYNLYFS